MSQSAVKERPIIFSAKMVRAIQAGRKTMTRRVVKPQPSVDESEERQWKCPYGEPGENLWLRETFQWDGVGTDVVYRADFDDETAKSIVEGSGDRWRPSIYMPRWASRILLDVTDVRVERLQDISESDAMSEGVASLDEFKCLWDAINGKRGYSWDSNPWVWVVSFRRVWVVSFRSENE